MFEKITFKRLFFVAACLIWCAAFSDSVVFADDLFPIPTFNPDPAQGYSDYIDLMSALPTTTPSIVVSSDSPMRDLVDDPVENNPSPSPTIDPFDVSSSPSPSGVSSFSYSSVKVNQYIARMVDGVRTYYRGSGSYSSPPDPVAGSYLHQDSLGWYSSINIFRTNHRLYSSDDYFYQSLIFTGVSDIPLSSTLVISPIWYGLNPTLLLPTTDFIYALDLDVLIHVSLTYNDSTLEYFDSSCSVATLQRGFSFDIPVRDNITSISVELFLYNNLAPDDELISGIPVIYFTADSDPYYAINVYLSAPPDSQETTAINKQTSLIGKFFSTATNMILDALSSLFVPTPTQIQQLIDRHIQGTDTSPLGPAWVITLRLVQILAAADDTPPTLVFPAFNFTINGRGYALWQSFAVDFTALPANLLTYSRMIGDILLSWSFVVWLSRKFRSFFSVRFADLLDSFEDE